VGIKKAGLDLPATEKELLDIGYYNGGTQTAVNATVLIDECKSTTTGEVSSYENDDGEYPVTAVASSSDVSPSTATGFKVAFKNNNLVSGETYICKLFIIKEGDPATIYEETTFFLNIIR
jgi:hypothetical protein